MNFTTTPLDNIIHLMLDGFSKWDAQYFVHIALYGYTYENTTAFFPLYPFIVRYLSWFLLQIISVLNIQSLILITSFLLNLYLFQKIAITLYNLTCMFRGTKFAFVTALMFCFNPASIFFSAVYSECLFYFLTLQSMLHGINASIKWLQSNSKYLTLFHCWPCLVYVALSTATRSNGILNIIFFVYIYFRVCVDKFYTKQSFPVKQLVLAFVILLLYILLTISPFILVQVYHYHLFCSTFKHNLPNFLVNFGKIHNFVLWGTFNENNQTWCHRTLPLAYSYVQDHYWNVGFLRYYEFKQVPNFCLALPVVYISLQGVINYMNKNRHMLLHFGILRKIFIAYNIINIKRTKVSNNVKLLLLDIDFALNVHVLFLTIFCLLCIHVQVTTRMIFSSTPIIYWFCCELLNSQNPKKIFIISYFALYFVIGTILFCNFLPWT